MTTNFIFFSFGFVIISFFIFRIIVRADYKKRSRLSPISYILETLVFALHACSIYIIYPHKFPSLPPASDNQPLLIFSYVVLALGLAILLAAWFKLGTKPSFGIDKDRLTTGGLYKYSRNPQLVGYAIVLVSITIMYFSVPMLLWLLLYVVASLFMIRTEEEFLQQKYGDDYREYCLRVPRFL